MAQQSNNAAVPASLLVAALGLGGLLLFDKPLNPDRPLNDVDAVYAHAHSDRVPARLWQDPLLPVEKHWKATESSVRRLCEEKSGSLEAIDTCVISQLEGRSQEAKKIEERVNQVLQSKKEQRLLILPVMINDGHYAEQRETRRRQRNALLTALSAKCYRPESPAFVNFTALKVNTDRVLLPYEIATLHADLPADRNRESCGKLFDAVLILWLSIEDEALSQTPLLVLATMLDSISGALGDDLETTIKVLGPANSKQLQSMLTELQEMKDQPENSSASDKPQFDTGAIQSQLADMPDVSSKGFAKTLMALADAYLDQELGDIGEGYDSSQKCITDAVEKEFYQGKDATADLTSCLSKGVFKDLTDSDSDWRESVLGHWNDLIQLASPRGLVNELVSALPSKTFADEVSKEKFTTCMLTFSETEADKSWVKAKSEASNNGGLYQLTNAPATVNACLKLGSASSDPTDNGQKAPPKDSVDETVDETVAAWRQANYGLSVEFPPRDTDRSVISRSLLLSAHNYLDRGLPWGFSKGDSLAECRTKTEQTTDLQTRYATCLNAQITPEEESDSDWSNTVASAWLGEFFLDQMDTSGPEEANPSNEEHDKAAISKLKKRDLDFISFRATQPTKYFPSLGMAQEASPLNGGDSDGDRLLEKAFARAGLKRVNFTSAIARDDETLALLVKEFQLRGLWPLGKNGHNGVTCKNAGQVFIVHELETDYGHNLAAELEDQIGRIESCNIIVERFGYLRGVDGEVLSVHGGSESASAAEGSQSASGSPTSELGSVLGQSASGSRMPAVGRRQLDYIERLADFLGRNRGGASDMPPVVVVLGSDVYDKKLLMQVIRRELPSALIATTDLDARLLSKKETPWAQNVLVASAFGLDIGENPVKTSGRAGKIWLDQDASSNARLGKGVDVPPYRDAYQTAFSYSVDVALQEYQGNIALAPRLFEIGRGRAFDITPDLGSLKVGNKTKHSDTTWPAQIKNNPGVFWSSWARTLILLLPLILTFVYWGMRRMLLPVESQAVEGQESRYSNVPEQRAYSVAMLIAVLSLVCLAVWLRFFWIQTNYEPWVLFQGVSALPTWMINLQAAILSIAALIVASGRVHQNNENLQHKFALNSVLPSGLQGVFIWRWYRAIEGKTQLGETWETEADSVWSDYRQLGQWRNRCLRILCTTAVACLLIALAVWLELMHLGESNHLFRNGGMPYFEGPGMSFASLALVFVLAMVMATGDALKLGQTFLRALCRYEVQWTSTDLSGIDPIIKNPGIKNALLTMDMITYRTERLLPLMLLPIALLLLLMFSQSAIFEGWHRDMNFTTLYGLAFVYLVYRAVQLQRTAIYARERLMTRIEKITNRAVGKAAESTEIDRLTSQRDSVLEYMSTVHRGAFVQWYRHPLIQSILMPLASVLALLVLQVFA